MLSIERSATIKNIILEKKSITVADMAKKFNVSSETIRRDFEALEKEGFLIKTYGGAALKERVGMHVSKNILSGILVEEKRRMAQAAAKQIRPNECIFLDHSTTVYEMCHLIENIPLTIMTNSLSIIDYFAGVKNIQLVTPGGNFNQSAYAFFGIEAIKFLQNHSLDKAFLSCRTLDIKRGLCEADELIAEMRRNIIENSVESYLLADHTKLGKTAFVCTCAASDIDCLITDVRLEKEWNDYLKTHHVKHIACP